MNVTGGAVKEEKGTATRAHPHPHTHTRGVCVYLFKVPDVKPLHLLPQPEISDISAVTD